MRKSNIYSFNRNPVLDSENRKEKGEGEREGSKERKGQCLRIFQN